MTYIVANLIFLEKYSAFSRNRNFTLTLFTYNNTDTLLFKKMRYIDSKYYADFLKLYYSKIFLHDKLVQVKIFNLCYLKRLSHLCEFDDDSMR